MVAASGVVPTKSAPLTDSSHKSIMNSSRAMDSLSTLMRRWHNLFGVSQAHSRNEGEAHTAGGRTQSPRTQTGAAWNTVHSGCRRALHIVCTGKRSSVGELLCQLWPCNGGFRTHERYATVSEGSWLK